LDEAKDRAHVKVSFQPDFKLIEYDSY